MLLKEEKDEKIILFLFYYMLKFGVEYFFSTLLYCIKYILMFNEEISFTDIFFYSSSVIP